MKAAARTWGLGALALGALVMARTPLRAGGSFDTGYGIWTPTGLWHRVAAPACVTPESGVACVYYGLDSGCDYATGQPQDAALSTAAPVTLTAGNAVLSFWLLYQVQSYDPACQDRLRLEYSSDADHWYLAQALGPQSDPSGGSPTEGLASGGGMGGPALWQYQTVSLASFVGTSYYWRFRYLSSDEMAGDPVCSPPDLLQNFLGYALDDVRLGLPPPVLTLGKSVAPSLGAPGDTFTFTLTATNAGASTADVQVWDSLPAGAAYVAAVGGTVSGGLAQWTLAGLGAGQARTLQLLVQASPTLPTPTDWIDSASASSTLAAGAVNSPQVLAKIRQPVLALTKSVSPALVSSGGAVTYSLAAENDTPLTASALTLSDPLPAGFSATQAVPPATGLTPAGALYWDLNSLAPGQVFSATIYGSVYGAQGQSVVNTATLAATTVSTQASARFVVLNPVQPTIAVQAVYPNPAPAKGAGQPVAAFIAYRLSTAMPVTLDIFDVAGEKLRSLSVPGAAGTQVARWDLNNAYGRRVASGLYILRLSSSLAVQPAPTATAYLAVLR